MISTANGVTYTSAKLVFVNCQIESGNIDPNQIERYITPKTIVIIPVHVYGNPCDLKTIHQIAEK